MAATPPVIFTHIHKTAGSTIHGAAYHTVGEDCWFLVRDDDDVATLKAMPQTRRDELRYIGGHIDHVTARDLFPEARFIAAVREPLSRTLSHFFFLIRQGGFDLDVSSEDALFEGFRRYYADAWGDRTPNLQCRMICSEPCHATALDTVRENYAMVWDSADTTGVWPEISRLLSGEEPIRIATEVYVAPIAGSHDDMAGGARPMDYYAFLPRELRAQVLADNAEDVALYRKLAGHGRGGVLHPV